MTGLQGTTATVPGLSAGPVPNTTSCGDPDESAILNRARSGDERAFGALADRYSRRVFRVCSALTRNQEEAEDCLQNTFLLALERFNQYRAEAQFSTWLTRIAVNVALSYLRKRSRKWAAEVAIESGEDGSAMLQLRARDRDPEAACFQHELRQVLEKEMRRLAPGLRLVLVLRDLEEFSTGETARVLGISEAAVKTRLLRARLKMRGRLAPVLQPPRQ